MHQLEPVDAEDAEALWMQAQAPVGEQLGHRPHLERDVHALVQRSLLHHRTLLDANA